MDQELEEIVDSWGPPEQYLPAEFLLNEDHPALDDYSKDKREIEQKIMAFGRAMKPNKREFARLIRTPLKMDKIASKLGKTPNTLYKWAHDPKVIRLTVLMDHLQQLIDGADADHRRAVLWRVALDNEEKRPNILVSCIQEINKMAGVYNTDTTGNIGNVVNIQINGELLPRGGLDVLPETFESRQAALQGKVVDGGA